MFRTANQYDDPKDKFLKMRNGSSMPVQSIPQGLDDDENLLPGQPGEASFLRQNIFYSRRRT